MVNIENKLNQIMNLIENGEYFTINKPRQFGKTTTMFLLEKKLKNKYTVISISFEGIGDVPFQNEEVFSETFLNLMKKSLSFTNKEVSEKIKDNKMSMSQLSEEITRINKLTNKKIVLMIDEVDKSSNNQLFLNFLGMLRTKYLEANKEKDYTFYSVILAGVHDVKSLKTHIRPNEEIKYNSPWNIAVDFDIDLAFNPDEISTMIVDYYKDRGYELNNVKHISEKLYYYTSGYPFLVSKLCQIIDEEMKVEKEWSDEILQDAVKIILKKQNTNFESLIKNLENNEDIYNLVYKIIIDGKEIKYNIDNPTINLCLMYGILKNKKGTLKVQNKIYEQRIYDYMASKIETSQNVDTERYNFRDNFIIGDKLNMELVLKKFQLFMKEQYSEKDVNFVERNGTLIFLAFIKPIINGKGFDFKEVQISEEKRLDVVITYSKYKYIIEMKKWYGEEYHKRGIKQLEQYLDINNQNKGYLVIFDTRKKSNKKQENIKIKNKEIFAVWV
ncbi:AAA family ATPase [Tepiditoga spiralis]